MLFIPVSFTEIIGAEWRQLKVLSYRGDGALAPSWAGLKSRFQTRFRQRQYHFTDKDFFFFSPSSSACQLMRILKRL